MKTKRNPGWWRRLLALMVVGVLLAACATPTPEAPAPTPTTEPELTPAPEEPTETTEPMPEETPTEEPTMEPGVPGGIAPLNPEVSGDVEFWHFWGSPVRRAAIRRAVALCEQLLPNIDVEEVFKPFGDIWTANIAAVAAGSGMPDVIVEDRPQLPQRARDEVETNLQPFIDRDGVEAGQFWEFTWNEAQYEGDVYGIPFETDVRVLFWNKQAFREAGLDPEVPPETWDDLLAYADALDVQNEDGSYSRIGVFPLWNAGVDFWARTNGWTPVINGVPSVDDPALEETLAWVKTWVDRYGGWQALQNFRAQFSAPPNDIFMSGAVAMVVDVGGYHSILSFYRPAYEFADGTRENMEWGISFIPYNLEKADWSGGFALSIPRGAPNPEAAWEFIKCLAGPEAQMSWARDTYAIPTLRDAAFDPVLMADPNWAAIVENMEYSSGSDYVPEYPNWNEQLNPRLELVWVGDLEPAAALEEAQQAIDDVIGR